MTNEEHTEEILIKSHSLGIKDQVWDISNKLREQDKTLDLHNSICKAYELLTK